MLDKSKIVFRKTITCKYCELNKVAYCLGLYPNNKDKKFVDSDGRQFNGKTCPNCQVLRMKLRQRSVRSVDTVPEPKE